MCTQSRKVSVLSGQIYGEEGQILVVFRWDRIRGLNDLDLHIPI